MSLTLIVLTIVTYDFCVASENNYVLANYNVLQPYSMPSQ